MNRENITILMVDDDEVDVMGVQRAFKRAKLGNNIVVAPDGQIALDKLREASVTRPYLVLLDMNMPRMNGIEFLEQARKDDALKNAIVFILTTSRAEEDKRAAYCYNVAGYIIKDRSDGGFINAAELLNQYVRNVEFPT